MDDTARRERAELRRRRATLSKGILQSREADLSPIRGAQAVSLVHHLTLESWALSGRQVPRYARDETPYRFVPGRST